MSTENARLSLRKMGFEDRILTPEASTATVELAAQAIGVTPGEIAKTLSFLVSGKAVLIVMAGTARADNKKFKQFFGEKAKMLPPEIVEELTGHAPGGVCPFGAKPECAVYLDESLRQYEIIYPAAGDANSAVRLTPDELERASGSRGWISIAKAPETTE